MADNRINRSGYSWPKPVVRKVPADSVPYGSSMTHRDYVWGAFFGNEMIAVAASSAEVRVKYNRVMQKRRASRSSS